MDFCHRVVGVGTYMYVLHVVPYVRTSYCLPGIASFSYQSEDSQASLAAYLLKYFLPSK